MLFPLNSQRQDCVCVCVCVCVCLCVCLCVSVCVVQYAAAVHLQQILPSYQFLLQTVLGRKTDNVD